MSNIKQSDRSINSLDALIINEDEKHMIKALSSCHRSEGQTWSVDFIEGKGLGTIILLHGYEILLACSTVSVSLMYPGHRGLERPTLLVSVS